MSVNKKTPQDAVTQVINSLEPIFKDRLQLGLAVREQHGQGEDSYGVMPPDAVVFARSNAEVAAVLKACHQWHVPVIPYGVGSSIEGHLLATRGGICIDLSQMDQILETNAADMDCRVQAGVTREQLNTELRYAGLFFPVDPGANASIGGMASTRASGTNAVRYGTMKENILGLTIVTPQGDIVQTGGRARKSAAGYDLTHLMIGAEGTLGVITEIRLRLHPIPEQIKAAVCSFDTVDAAALSVIDAMQCGLPLARIELLNALQMQACIAYSDLQGFAPRPTLFFEFHGSEASVSEQIASLQAITDDHGGTGFSWATSTEERNALWKARHNAYYAGMALLPGHRALTTDICVPISQLADTINDAEAKARELDLTCPVVGHVGDGNFHMLILVEPGNNEQLGRAQQLSHHLVSESLRRGGTCTGEHGIGIGKKSYLLQEHGAGVALMQSIKRALDPHHIMNPDKIFDL